MPLIRIYAMAFDAYGGSREMKRYLILNVMYLLLCNNESNLQHIRTAWQQSSTSHWTRTRVIVFAYIFLQRIKATPLLMKFSIKLIKHHNLSNLSPITFVCLWCLAWIKFHLIRYLYLFMLVKNGFIATPKYFYSYKTQRRMWSRMRYIHYVL